ncbi:lactonase family protein [Compostimonas suwonensis]|uniref:6-phosphogluconolactonase (Cycloisomerase 2 family) n=1 Tax=Compostimonas suwonensis TaxID=1048394 RepID=A0A2M9C3L6_9MICO|nr:beta-propeller fold lactonase family protein [Compostimonas suwonensis]PJJ65057.1 6-phosphogluconolactonase (cycloisomerase 2 family) [Compostimonas suwonensis]
MLWFGSYTSEMGGEGSGLGTLRLDERGAVQDVAGVTPAASPSFLAFHPSLPVVYAVSESDGALLAFRADPAGPVPLGEPRAAGAAACHVAVSGAGEAAIVCCWGDGTVNVYELDDEGALASDSRRAAASSDPHAALAGEPRQSRAHEAVFLPSGLVATTDLGHDVVRFWRLGAQSLELDHEVVLPFGCGPRHMAISAEGILYVVTEFSIEVVVLAPDDATARYTIAGSSPVLPRPIDPDQSGAEISLAGGLLYVTVRGANRVAVLSVSGDGRVVAPLDDVDCAGDWPRHHLVHGDVLYVANQRSGDVATFELDERGIPGFVRSAPIGSPTVLAWREG